MKKLNARIPRSPRRLWLVFFLGCLAALAPAGRADEFSWAGINSGDWSDGGNWSPTFSAVPADGDNLIFNNAVPANDAANNDIADLALRSLKFVNNTFTNALTIGGQAFTLDSSYGEGVTISNGNTTASRVVTIENDITLVGNQSWLSASGVLAINGNLTGDAGVLLSIRGNDPGTTIENAPGVPTIRLAGDNSGFIGTINFRRASDSTTQRSSLMFMNPSAMIGGNVNMADAQRLVLTLNGNGVATSYTFGIGTGNNEVNLSGSDTGINAYGGNVVWDPGNGGGYTWANVAGNRLGLYARVAGDFSTVTMGTAGQTLTLGGAAKTIQIGSGALATIAYTLGDDGSGRALTKSGGGLLELAGGAFEGAGTGSTSVSAGGLSLSGEDQIANGNLNLSGGILVFNNLTWSAFAADRSNGTSADQWQFSGTSPGFAARGAAVTVDENSTTATTFDRAFTLGMNTRASDGTLYANAPVILDRGDSEDTITLSAAANRTIGIVGGLTVVNAHYGVLANSPIHEIAGVIGGGGAGRTLTINAGGVNGQAGILRLSNAGNNFVGNVVIGGSGAATPDFNNGQAYGVLIATDDGVFGQADNTVTIGASSPGGQPNTGWLLLLEDQAGTGKTFDRGLFYDLRGTPGTPAYGLGAYAGQVTYTGSLTNRNQTGIATVNLTSTLQLHAEAGASFTLGTDTDAADLVNERLGTAINIYRKTGAGLAVLHNANFTDTTGSHYFNIQNGVLRETGNAANNSVQGNYLILSGGVIETANAHYGAGYFNRALSLTVDPGNIDLRNGGGFAAYGGDLTVDLGAVGVNKFEFSQGNFYNDNVPVRLSSATADGTVELIDNINLRYSAHVFDVADGAALIDARLSGSLSSGNAGAHLIKGGAGTLEITSAQSGAHNWGATVSNGTLLVNNTTGSAIGPGGVTVKTGASLGGAGYLSGPVTVEAGGNLTPGSSPGTLTINNTLTLNDMTYLWELGSSAYDTVTVNGMITLADTPMLIFALRNLDAVDPTGQTYTLFSATLGLNGGYTYDFDAESYNQFNMSGVQITDDGSNIYLSGLTPVPEPGTLALLGLGATALALRRKRGTKSA